MARKKLCRPAMGALVEVLWSDSWSDRDFDGDPADYPATVAQMVSVGYFVKAGKDGIVLARDREEIQRTMRHFLVIPRVNVKTIRPIAEGPA